MQIANWPVAGDRELELLRVVLESPQWGGYHPLVQVFEKQFADFQQSQHCISAMNGTVTLEVLLQAAGIGPGDEVIVPAISFVATATAVSRVGATPVFVDIEEYSFNIDPERAAAAITPKTKAMIVVHFGGPMADMDRLVPLAASEKILLIEDAAHAQGSEWRGKRAGSFGWASSFSFQNGKVLTAGEGGAILTENDELATRLRSLCNIGRKAGENFFFHYELGTNARLTAWQAAVLVAQLERLPAQIEQRARNAARLIAATREREGLVWQHVPAQVTAHSWYLMLGRIQVAESGQTRDELHALLTSKGVPCTPFYPHTLYQNPVFQNLDIRVEPCPNAEACVRDAFWFPHRVLMSEEATIEAIAAILK